MAGLIEPRPDIDALLNAETYQNMSDAEIDAIVAYKVERATRDAVISRDARAHDAIMRELMARQADAQADADASMKAALAAQITYKEV